MLVCSLDLMCFLNFHWEDANKDLMMCLTPWQSSGMEHAAEEWKVVCLQLCSPQLDVGASAKVGRILCQRRPPEKGLEHLSYEYRKSWDCSAWKKDFQETL